MIGMGYFSIMFQSNPVNGEKKYTLTNDAYRTSEIPLRRLFKAAGLIERVRA